MRNESKAGSWLTVVCEAPGGSAIPIGTRVTVTAGGRKTIRNITSGDSSQQLLVVKRPAGDTIPGVRSDSPRSR